MPDRRVERGVYATDAGWRVYVRHAGRLHTKRLPATLTLPQARRAREDLAYELRHATPARVRPEPGTFAGDAARYLQAVASMPTIAWRTADIGLWVAVFGPRRRATITTADIDIVLHRWIAAGYAGSTVRHRRSALMHLWHRLDGKGAPNPVRDSFKPDEAEPEARGLPYGLVAAILRRMGPSKTKARLLVMAFTGLAQSQIAHLQPEDVDYAGRSVFVRRRKKGKGRRGFAKPLTDAGLDALRTFAREEAWGPFSRDSLRRSFTRACHKLWLGGLRPYDLRHSYGSAIYAASGDIKATQDAMGHGDIRTTMRYTLRAVEPRVAAAIARFGEATKDLRVTGRVAGGRQAS